LVGGFGLMAHGALGNGPIIENYTPTSPLAVDVPHSVSMTAVDNVGATATFNWTFTIQTYPDMDFTGPCTGCHIGYPAPNHPMTNCDGCHGGSSPIGDCRGCHGWGQRSPDVLSSPYGHETYWEGRCDWCHSAAFAYKIPVHPANNEEYHNTTAPMDNCRPCHVTSLTREHAQRTDSAGDKLNCQTCHASPDRNVQLAIANKQKNCDACHGTVGHITKLRWLPMDGQSTATRRPSE